MPYRPPEGEIFCGTNFYFVEFLRRLTGFFHLLLDSWIFCNYCTKIDVSPIIFQIYWKTCEFSKVQLLQ